MKVFRTRTTSLTSWSRSGSVLLETGLQSKYTNVDCAVLTQILLFDIAHKIAWCCVEATK